VRAVDGRKRGNAALNWPSVPGRILDSRLVQVKDDYGDQTTTSSITYSYEVASESFQGGRVTYSGGEKARETVQKYRPGAIVQVFYDPKKSKSSVLVPGSSGTKPLLVVEIGVILLGIILSGVNMALTRGSGNGPVQYTQAVELYNQSKFPQAKAAFEDVARRGNNKAKVYLGVMYAKG
jgi:TPR repeat protein